MSLYDNVMAWMNGPSGPGTAYPWMADPVGQAGMYYAQGGYNSIQPPVQQYLSSLPTDPFAGQKGFWEDLPTDPFAGQKGFWEDLPTDPFAGQPAPWDATVADIQAIRSGNYDLGRELGRGFGTNPLDPRPNWENEQGGWQDEYNYPPWLGGDETSYLDEAEHPQGFIEKVISPITALIRAHQQGNNIPMGGLNIGAGYQNPMDNPDYGPVPRAMAPTEQYSPGAGSSDFAQVPNPAPPPTAQESAGVPHDGTAGVYQAPPPPPPDPYLEYPEQPETAFGPDDDLMQAAIIQADLMAQEEAAERAFEMAHQAQPDPFAGWMEDYNAQTEKMVADAEEAHRRGLWLNLGKSFLADPGNWGTSMGGAMDALNQYNYAKAGLSTLEAEREKELLDSTLVYSQIGKNKASADADPRSWAEKKFDTQLQMIGEGLVSGRYDEAAAQAALESILGMGQEYSVLDGVGVVGLGPTGEPTLNGKPITSEELGRLTQAAAAAKAQIGPQVKSDRERAETDARIAAIQAKNPNMDSGTAGTYATSKGWRTFADMDVYNKEMENRGMRSTMNSITSSVTTMQKEIIDWLERSRGVPLTPEQRAMIEGLEDAEIERIMQEIQNEQ